jgi:signal transduction histidine kinase
MKVKTATLLFTALIFGLLALLGFSLIKITTWSDQGADDLTMAAETVRVAKELKSTLLTHNRNTFLHSLYQDPRRLENNRELQTRITMLIATLELITDSEEENLILAGLKTQTGSYLEKREQLALADLFPMEQYNEASKEVDKTFTYIEKLIERNTARMASLIEGINDRNRLADRLAIFLLITGAVVLLILIGIMFLSIVYPLRVAAETISSFSSGNVSARIKPGGLMEIRQIGSSFNSMADRLEEKQREQLRFIASIAHDLRNPLNTMSMASELLAHKDNQGDPKSAAIILRQVKNLDRMVGDLLDTASVESGNIDLQYARHDISSLVMDAVQFHQADSNTHRINPEISGESLFCQCDGGRITQVMNNLLSNAIKYSPGGGVITVKAARLEEEIAVSVSDRGIGIAPEDIDNIFRPFNRTSATRSTIPGIGLGLSVSRHIIEAHGGTLKVESNPGAGSTFYFLLPVRIPGRAVSAEHMKEKPRLAFRKNAAPTSKTLR